jgi:hypothetical protein
LVTGIEVVAGMAVAYLVRKLRRVGDRADAEVDRALDAGMDSLHKAISRRLGHDQALLRLETEAAESAEPTELTVRRSTDAIAQAALDDPDFAGELEALVARLDELAAAAGQPPATGSVHNTITHSTVHGPTFQGRDFTGPITTGSPNAAPVAAPAPGSTEAGEQGKQQPPAR